MHDFLKAFLEIVGDVIRDVATDWAMSNYTDKKKAEKKSR